MVFCVTFLNADKIKRVFKVLSNNVFFRKVLLTEDCAINQLSY